jgi:hypothetical protein
MDAPPPRQPYEPPDVARVKLAADELAVASCKTRTSITGPNPGGCFRSNCRNAGS